MTFVATSSPSCCATKSATVCFMREVYSSPAIRWEDRSYKSPLLDVDFETPLRRGFRIYMLDRRYWHGLVVTLRGENDMGWAADLLNMRYRFCVDTKYTSSTQTTKLGSCQALYMLLRAG